MQIVAALFVDDIDMRQVPGPSTRIDLKGIQFSGPAPSSLPFLWAPHLVVLLYCPPEHKGTAALEVTFHLDEEQVARNVQALQIEPGRFGRQLVRPEINFESFGTVTAHVRVDLGATTVVPWTLLPPAP